MDENQNENMTAPPSPEVDNNSTPDADMEAWIQKTIGDYNKTQTRPNLASQLKSQPDEFSYGRWNEDEENIIKNEIAPELIRDMTEDDDTVTKNFQKILNDPYETLYGNSDLGNKVKDKLIDKVLNKSWEKTERVPDFMNKLQHMRKLYYIAVNAKDEGYRKSAVKQINTYRKALGQFMDGLDDKSMQELKNAMLLTEYGQAYQDITSKNVPNSTEIYIIPRETSIPIITTQPIKGAYKTTVGDFKTDLYKLATNRDSDAIDLPSGFTMTRGNDKRTSLKDTDLREMLNPEFYRELTEEQRERLGKEGLELFFKPHNADIVAALDRIGLKLGNEDILDSIDASTKAVIEAILASQADAKTKQERIMKELEKAKENAKAARRAQAEAEAESDDIRLDKQQDDVKKSIEEDEQNIIYAATDFNPMNEVIKQTNGDYGDIDESITTAIKNSDKFILTINGMQGLDQSAKNGLVEAANELKKDIEKAASKRSVSNPIGQKLGKEVFTYDANKLAEAHNKFERTVQDITKNVNNAQIERKLSSDAGLMMLPIAKITAMADKVGEMGSYHHTMGKIAKDPKYYRSFLDNLDNDYQRQLVKNKYKEEDIVPILADAALSKVPHMEEYKGTSTDLDTLRKYFKEPSNEHLISIGRMGFMTNPDTRVPYVGMNSDANKRVRTGKYTPEQWLRMLGLGSWWDESLVDKSELYDPNKAAADKHSLDDLKYVFGGYFNYNPLDKEGFGLTYAKPYLIPFLYGDKIKNYKTAGDRLKYLKAMEKRIPESVKKIVR